MLHKSEYKWQTLLPIVARGPALYPPKPNKKRTLTKLAEFPPHPPSTTAPFVPDPIPVNPPIPLPSHLATEDPTEGMGEISGMG